MPVWSKLLDCEWDIVCKCDAVESDPRMLDVIGDATIAGRNSELLELSELLPNEWLPADDTANEDCATPAEANRRDGAIELASEGVDKAGNFTVKLVDPKAGSAAGAFIPKSSASVRAAYALVSIPQNNSINLQFITLAPNM